MCITEGLLVIRINGCRKIGQICPVGRLFFSTYLCTATTLLLFICGPILVRAELEFKNLTEFTDSSFKVISVSCTATFCTLENKKKPKKQKNRTVWIFVNLFPRYFTAFDNAKYLFPSLLVYIQRL